MATNDNVTDSIESAINKLTPLQMERLLEEVMFGGLTNELVLTMQKVNIEKGGSSSNGAFNSTRKSKNSKCGLAENGEKQDENQDAPLIMTSIYKVQGKSNFKRSVNIAQLDPSRLPPHAWIPDKSGPKYSRRGNVSFKSIQPDLNLRPLRTRKSAPSKRSSVKRGDHFMEMNAAIAAISHEDDDDEDYVPDSQGFDDDDDEDDEPYLNNSQYNAGSSGFESSYQYIPNHWPPVYMQTSLNSNAIFQIPTHSGYQNPTGTMHSNFNPASETSVDSSSPPKTRRSRGNSAKVPLRIISDRVPVPRENNNSIKVTLEGIMAHRDELILRPHQRPLKPEKIAEVDEKNNKIIAELEQKYGKSATLEMLEDAKSTETKAMFKYLKPDPVFEKNIHSKSNVSLGYKYVCTTDDCPKKVPRGSHGWKQHILNHHWNGLELNRCPLCFASYALTKSLRVHMVDHVPGHLSSKLCPFTCKYPGCEFGACYQKKILAHYEKDHQAKTYQSPFPGCTLTFQSLKTFENHKRLHEKSKDPIVCKCGEEFPCHGMMRLHFRTCPAREHKKKERDPSVKRSKIPKEKREKKKKEKKIKPKKDKKNIEEELDKKSIREASKQLAMLIKKAKKENSTSDKKKESRKSRRMRKNYLRRESRSGLATIARRRSSQ